MLSCRPIAGQTCYGGLAGCSCVRDAGRPKLPPAPVEALLATRSNTPQVCCLAANTYKQPLSRRTRRRPTNPHHPLSLSCSAAAALPCCSSLEDKLFQTLRDSFSQGRDVWIRDWVSSCWTICRLLLLFLGHATARQWAGRRFLMLLICCHRLHHCMPQAGQQWESAARQQQRVCPFC